MKRRNLPEAVLVKLDEIRKERGIYAEVKLHRKGMYYVYQGRSGYDHKRKRFIKTTTYIGRITADGSFIEPKHVREPALDYISRHLPYRINEAYAELENRYGSIFIKKIEDNSFYIYRKRQDKEEFIGTIGESGSFSPVEHKEVKESSSDLMLLQCLSMNSRMKYKRMAEIAGLKSEHEAYSQVKSLVKRLDIRYTASVDIYKMGYSPLIIFIKFRNGRPKTEELREVFENHPNIQFVALTEGKFDAIAYMIHASTDPDFWEAVEPIFSSKIFKTHDSEVTVSPFYIDYGFIPLREIFFDRVLKEKVWHKKKGVKRTNELLEREWAVLKEVVVNGGIDFSEIDKKYELGKGAALYTFSKLKDNDTIFLETININGLRYRYVKVMLISFVNMSKFLETRDNLIAEIISNNGMINKYALVGDIGSPLGLILFQPVVGENEDIIDRVNDSVKGIDMDTLVITNILVGTLVFRRRDNTYTMQYEILVEHNKVKAEDRIDYQ